MNRKIYYWKLRDAELQLGERTLIMGVLNVTPDSFSDGGHFNDPDRAYARALELEEQGADIIDIGAESTKPGAHRITADEEWQRLVPVLKRLRGNLRAPLSLDTYKSEIAERALEYGVEIFNDPSGLTFDPNMAKVAANGNAGLILNHMRGQPETTRRSRAADAGRHGFDRGGTGRDRKPGPPRRCRTRPCCHRSGSRIRQTQGTERRNSGVPETAFRAGLPDSAVGPSRKSFLTQASESATLFATAAAVTASVLNGAHIVRVHDVREMHVVIQVAEEIARAAVPKTLPDEDRPAVRAARSPNVESERPRPPRPPYAKPILKPKDVVPGPNEEQPDCSAGATGRTPALSGKRPDREQREGSVPPRRDFKDFKNDRFKPAAPSRPFVRKDDRREGRPSRPVDREQSRPPYAKPPYSKPAYSKPAYSKPAYSKPAYSDQLIRNLIGNDPAHPVLQGNPRRGNSAPGGLHVRDRRVQVHLVQVHLVQVHLVQVHLVQVHLVP